MTFVVPNYFLEEQPEHVIGSDGIFSVTYSTQRESKCIMVRNVTHAAILLTKGSKRLQLEEEEIVLNEGSLFFLAQGNYLMSEIVSPKGEYEAIMLYFDDGFVADFMQKYVINSKQECDENVVSFVADEALKETMYSFKRYLSNKLDHQTSIMKLKTEEIFLHLLSQHPKKFGNFLSTVLDSSKNRTMYILEANYDILENVEQMSRMTRLSPAELRKQVVQSTGLTPKAWLDKKRLEQAATLLRHSDQSISSIATTCGYSNLSWFGVQFKKMYGTTPKMYQQSA